MKTNNQKGRSRFPQIPPDREGIRKNLIQRMVGESVGEFGRGPETSARINA